ncbi:MAG: hypothetical protein ABI405_11320 [Parafilimonas sp.]
MQTELTAINNWTFTQKLFFRFSAAYFFIFIFPFPIGYLPFTDAISTWLNGFWDALVPWAGKYILHVSYPVTIKPNGSGDTTYNYVQLFLMVLLAIIAAIIWSVADRKRKNYDALLYWVMVYVRYYLAFTMMSYGIYKIIKTQFPFPFYNLNETYGESSPMGLLWNFMGYSTAFNMFTGLAEAIAGFLLLFRKTTTFGALMSMTVLSNIVAMNFCFDVPVKIYSSILLLMAVFIAAPDMKRLINFFFRNKAVPAVNIQPKFPKRWMKITWISVKILLIASVVYLTISQVWTGYKSYGDDATQRTPLFGIYNVENFVKNNDTLPKLATDTAQWKSINISFAGYATIKTMNDSTKGYSFTPDTAKKTIVIYSYSDTAHKSTLTYAWQDSAHLILHGKLKDDSVYIVMQKQDLKKLQLLSRGFHWINEYPYNR